MKCPAAFTFLFLVVAIFLRLFFLISRTSLAFSSSYFFLASCIKSFFLPPLQSFSSFVSAGDNVTHTEI